VAGESTHLGFTTDITQMVEQVTAGLTRVKAEVEKAGGSLNSAQFGDQLLAHFQADAAKIVQTAQEARAKVDQTFSKAISGATASKPYVQPAGGAYQTQQNKITADEIRNLEALSRTYGELTPVVASQVQAAARLVALNETGAQAQQVLNSALQLRAAAEQKATEGINIPVRSAITGEGAQGVRAANQINRRLPAPFAEDDVSKAAVASRVDAANIANTIRRVQQEAEGEQRLRPDFNADRSVKPLPNTLTGQQIRANRLDDDYEKQLQERKTLQALVNAKLNGQAQQLNRTTYEMGGEYYSTTQKGKGAEQILDDGRLLQAMELHERLEEEAAAATAAGNKLIELRNAVLQKQAIQLGNGANSNIAVSRDEIYGVGKGGATRLSGDALTVGQQQYDRALADRANQIQTQGQREAGVLDRAYTQNERLNRTTQELQDAEYVLTNTIRRAGQYFQTPNGIYKQTSGGAAPVVNPLEQASAQQALAGKEPTTFFQGIARGLTSRSAYASGGGAPPSLSNPDFLKAIPGNIGTRLGSVVESFAGFAALGAVFKAVSDTKKETLDYIDSLTNLEVRMQRTGSVTAEFTNQLEGLSRLAGSNVGAELDAAARSISAFGDASKNTVVELRNIGEEGAAASSQLAVIAGTDLPTASNNLVAVASSFGLAASSLGQVTDAVANAKMLGGESAEITSGLAAVAGAAQEAGYNTQQAADLISLVTARTNESGAAAATRLAAIFQLIGSHQDVLKNLGIDTSGTVKSQIEALAAAFPSLTAAQQKLTLSQLGGRTALRELLPLLQEQPRLAAAYEASLDHAGAGADEFNRKNADLAGLFRKLGGDITNIQLNLERSGAFNDIGLALKGLEPGLRTLSDLLGLFDRAITLLGPLQGLPGILLDTYLALKLIDSLGRLPAILGAIPGLGNTRALPKVITNRVPQLAQKGASAGAEGADAGATEADTAATNANTAAKNANAAANSKQAETETFQVRAAREAAAAARTEEAAIAALQYQVDLEILALRDLAGAEDLQAKIAGDVTAATTEEASALALLAEARAGQVEATTALDEAENGLAASLERQTLAQQAAARAALANAEALALEAKAAAQAGESSAFGLGVGRRVTGVRAGAARQRATAAAGAAETEAGAGGLVAGGAGVLGTLSVVGGVAIAGDLLFSSIKSASDATKKSLNDTATAMEDLGKAIKPDDIHSAADALRSAAAERDKSSSGIIGSTIGFFRKYTGGPDSNADAKDLREAATAADARAKALADIQTQNADLGNPAVFQGAPNSIDAVKTGFQAMALAGDSAATQIDALVTALGGLNGAANTGPGHILAGGSADLGAKLAGNLQATAEASLTQSINDVSQLSGTDNRNAAVSLLTRKRITGETGANDAVNDYYGGGKSEGDKNNINFADPKKFQAVQKQVGDITTKFITDAGLDEGGVITDAQAQDLANQLADLYVDPSATKKQKAAMKTYFAAHIKKQILNDTDPGTLIVNQTTADQISALLTAQAQTAGQDTLATTGDQLAAAQTTYNKILEVNALVLSKNRTLSEAQNQATIVAQRAVADAYASRADASDAYTKDLLPLDDAVGRAQDDYNTALRHIQEAVAKGDFNGILKADSEAVDTKRVLDQANLDNSNASITDAVPQDNASATADAAVKVARANLAPLDKGTKQYKDQAKVLADAQHAAMLAHIEDSNSLAQSLVDPNDQNAVLVEKAQEATATYVRLATSGNAGLKEIHDAFLAMNAAADAVLTNTLADTNSVVTDAVDPRNLVGVANAAVTTTANTVKSDVARGVKGKPLNDDKAASRNAGIDALTTGITDTNLGADAAVAVGDSYGEAYNAYLDLVRTAAGQIGNTRLATLRQADVQRVAAEKLAVDLRHGANDARIDPRNSIALAQEALANDVRALGVGGQSTQDLQGEQQQKAQDALNLAQLTTARNNSRRAALSRQGDPTAEARVQLQGASAILRNDLKGTDQYYQDLATVRSDQMAYAQALRDHAKNLALLAGDTTDPVEQARLALAEATAKLRDDRRKKTGDLAQDQLDKETTAASLQKAQFDQNLSTQQTMYDLQEISAQTYLQGLQRQDASLRKQLAGMHKGQQGYQQYVDELNTVDQAIQGLNSQLSGQFNLGDIKLPTIYEVRRSAAQGGVAAAASAAGGVTNNAVTINGADFAAVVSYINSILGRTSSTVATTGRKATA
jgi:hypothetical protein